MLIKRIITTVSVVSILLGVVMPFEVLAATGEPITTVNEITDIHAYSSTAMDIPSNTAAYIGDFESTTMKYYIAVRQKYISDGVVKHVISLPKASDVSNEEQ